MNQLPHRMPRPERKVTPHYGRLTESERDSLKNTVLNGDRPYPNLVAANYAAENEKTGDWYLTETGYQKLREFTISHNAHVIHE